MFVKNLERYWFGRWMVMSAFVLQEGVRWIVKLMGSGTGALLKRDFCLLVCGVGAVTQLAVDGFHFRFLGRVAAVSDMVLVFDGRMGICTYCGRKVATVIPMMSDDRWMYVCNFLLLITLGWVG
jgi:hypothetical protein